MRKIERWVATLLTSAALWLGSPIGAAHAGCGCDKPPPVPATIRPRVTYAGTEVTIFGADLSEGATYTVSFASGTTTGTASVEGVAVRRRDLADGETKVQLPVTVPVLPLGPTRITVSLGKKVLVRIDDADFTVAPDPVAIPAEKTVRTITAYRAAVSRAGVVYVTLDLTAVQDPLVVRAQMRRYPLRFAGEDAIFYNVQGYLMQALDASMPGLFTLTAAHDRADSDVLQYSRHEFNSYFLQHAERQPHAVDPTDPNWHIDGSPHIDHNHLILALPATLEGGGLPKPGATSESDLVIKTFSLFSRGLTGVEGVTMETLAFTTSYDSRTLAAGHEGDVLAGGPLKMDTLSQVDGDATAASFDLGLSTAVTGDMVRSTAPVETMPVLIPKGLTDLKNLALTRGRSLDLVGPASFVASQIRIDNGSTLNINNAAGPVTIYVAGAVEIADKSSVNIADPNPEKFAIYVVGTGPVSVSGSSAFAGVVYAPQAPVVVKNDGHFYGSFVGSRLTVRQSSVVAYDVALRGSSGSGSEAQPTPTPGRGLLSATTNLANGVLAGTASKLIVK